MPHPEQTARSNQPLRPSSSRRKWLFVFCGGFAIGLVGFLWYAREPTIALTRSGVDAASRQWRQVNLLDYDYRFRMHGAEYAVSVRDGLVVEIKTDGLVAQPSNPEAYSVEGLLRILEQELDLHSSTELQNNTIMRVRFHPKLGYIERYVRGKSPLARATSIETTQFEPMKKETP